MNRIKLLAASALTALSLAACGGGGGSAGGGATNNPTNTTADTVISGMASKGPIDGTANIYALNADGSKGSLLISAPVVKGSYSANIGKYAVPVVIEVTGDYTDEATGQLKTITAGAPLRAALSNASGNVSAAVTPLTELAVQKAGALTPSNIDNNNKLVSNIFKVDIINTQPVAPTNAALSGSSITQSQKDYTLALAALSQISQTKNEPLSTTLASMAGGITPTGMNSQTVTSFQNAVTAFVSNINNKTGVTDVSATNLTKINGGTVATFTLAIQGNVAANAIKGIQLEIVMPAGLTVRYDPNSVLAAPVTDPTATAIYDHTKGKTLTGVVTAYDSTASIASMFSTSDSLLSFGLMTSVGIGAGDFAIITCDVQPGYTVPLASALSVRNIKAVDGSSVTLGNVNVTVK